MLLGMSPSILTVLHVAFSLLALLAGAAVIFGMVGGRDHRSLTLLFLVTTAITSLTGYLFPATTVLRSHVVGGISLIALTVAATAYLWHGLSGRWRWIYVVGALLAFYLNVFVAIVQAFRKVSVLHALAPTGSEPPFIATQLIVVGGFLFLGFMGVWRFHPQICTMK